MLFFFSGNRQTIKTLRLRILLCAKNSQQWRKIDGGLINYYSFAAAFGKPGQPY